MIIDKALQVADDQAVTTTAASTDVIDFGQAHPNTGNSDRLHMVITVGETVTASGAATVTVAVQDSADNGTYVTRVATGAISKDDLVAGAQIVLPMPKVHGRYVRAHFTVGTGPLTAGKFSAQVVAGYQLNPAYPSATN